MVSGQNLLRIFFLSFVGHAATDGGYLGQPANQYGEQGTTHFDPGELSTISGQVSPEVRRATCHSSSGPGSNAPTEQQALDTQMPCA